MKRNEIIEYLNDIKVYLSLQKICDLYNGIYVNQQIDYNNLRWVLNGKKPSRVSDERLENFHNFLFEDLFETRFKIESNVNVKFYYKIIDEVNNNINLIIEESKEKINNEFQD